MLEVTYAKIPHILKEIGKDNYPELADSVKEYYTKLIHAKFASIENEINSSNCKILVFYDEVGQLFPPILDGNSSCELSGKASTLWR